VTSLSVACVSRDTTGRLATILRLYRAVATEIVVALDDSVLEEAVAALGDAADRVLAIPFRPPVERSLAWLHGACAGGWVFRIDDDEVPSAALLAELADLGGKRGLTHAFVPRRWLWGGAHTYLDSPPWRPDHQLRLVRNDTATTWFPGVTHWPIAAIGEHRYLEAPLYHLDLLLNPRGRREAKARSYEHVEPGRRLAGLPLNLAYYVPELRSNAPLAPVPAEDSASIRSALEPRPAPAAGRHVDRIDAGDIDALWDGAEPGAGMYRAELTLAEEMAPMAIGEVRTIDVRVRNRGDRIWAPGGAGRFPVAVSYRWDGHGDGLRTPLPERLPPGAETLVPVAIAAPAEPGSHRLSLDLVEEHVRWFGCALEADVEVVRRARVVITGENEEAQRLAAARLGELRPELEPVLLVPDPGTTARRLGYAAAESAHGEVLRPSSPATLRRAAAVVARAGSSDVPFVEAVRGADAVLVVGDPRARRERLVEKVVRGVALRLGVPVVEARSPDQVDRAIASVPVNGP
jgi:hypothetical protein